MIAVWYAKGRRRPTPGAIDTCPTCGSQVVAKCGEVNVWHWAHQRTADCDPWAEPITQWHLDWQAKVSEHRREITLGNHRADMALPSGVVCEVQHSPIDPETVWAREDFYRRMIWLMDARDAYDRDSIRFEKTWTHRGKRNVTARWLYKRLDTWNFTRPVYLDGGPELLRVERVFGYKKFWFTAQRIPTADFISYLSSPHPTKGEAFPYFDGGRVKWRRAS